MTDRVLGNYLRAQRKASGLSLHEIGKLLGYKNQWQVSRHERSRTAPPLLIALAYEAIYHVPVSVLFSGMYATVAQVIDGSLTSLERTLASRQSAENLPSAHLRKLKWLNDRKKSPTK